MFGLSQRTWCRAMFVLFGLAPTLLMSGWAVWAQTPFCRELARRHWQRAIEERVGLPVEIGGVERGSAGAVRLIDVRIVEPESARVLASSPSIGLEPTGSRWRAFVSAPRIQQAEVVRLLESLHEHAVRRATSDGGAVDWTATNVTFESATAPATFSELRGRWESKASGPQVDLEFTVAGTEPPVQIRLAVERDRQTNPPRTRCRLETIGAPVPVALLPEAFPELAGWGDRCGFEGLAELSWTADGWSGELQGRWRQVDLDRWTERLPHKLSGWAELELRRARWVDGRLTEARGTLASRGGVVSRSLLVTAGDRRTLDLQLQDRIKKSTEPLWRYQQLAFDFFLGADGLQLVGRCVGHPPGTLLADSQGPLLQDSPRALVPAVALVRAFAPASEVQVPAGLETDSMLRRLPLPSLNPPPELAERPPSTRVRLE